jgi:hypothetical protein
LRQGLIRGGAKNIFSLLLIASPAKSSLNPGSSIIRIPLVEFVIYGTFNIPQSCKARSSPTRNRLRKQRKLMPLTWPKLGILKYMYI